MTDDELDDVYFDAFDKNWRKTGRGDSSDTAGLRAVAEAADRAAVRRTLDELEEIVNDGTVVPRLALMQYIDKTREGLE